MAKKKTPEQVVRDIVYPKQRRKRSKSAADEWYEKMLADWRKNGMSDLASALEKMKKK